MSIIYMMAATIMLSRQTLTITMLPMTTAITKNRYHNITDFYRHLMVP